MIYIDKDSTNLVALELSQTLSTSQSYFLFEFVWEEGVEQQPRYFTTPDISTSTSRYNLFAVTESFSGSTSSVDNQPINLNPGQYTYNVYASTSSIDFNNLDVFISQSISSTGRMVVSDTSQSLYPHNRPITTGSVYD